MWCPVTLYLTSGIEVWKSSILVIDVLINVLEQNISKQIRGKGSDSEENSGGPITSAPCRETEPEKAAAYDVTPAKHFVL